MREVSLTGLDGTNPLGFMAALGALDVAHEVDPTSCLAWREYGSWQPTLRSGLDRDELLDAVLADRDSWRADPVIGVEYDGKRDLKPPPSLWREYVRARLSTRRSLDFASAFATDVATDNKGNIKPTALHFTAGQQTFLGMVWGLIDAVTREDVEEALFGPWRYVRELPVLQWDATATRDWALRAGDPSKDKKAGVPGADWLAFRGLRFFQCVPVRDRVVTTAIGGGWKTGYLRWPLWTRPLGIDAVKTALRLPELACQEERARIAGRRALRARGIAAVFESSIRRSDQGGYGSFSPAVPV